MENKVTIEASRVIRGVNITLRGEVPSQDVQDSIEGWVDCLTKNLPEELNSLPKEIKAVASVKSAPLEIISPAPVLLSSISELPNLLNPPHTYAAGDAAVEVLDPNRSTWASNPRTVREIQDRLVALGVRGVNNLASFDAVMRRLNGQGKVRREKVEGTYRYYSSGNIANA